jgi:hypothetical protein
MPAAAFAACGRARALLSRLKLVEWLVVGADEEIGCGVAPSHPRAGRSSRDRGERSRGAASAPRLVPRRNAAGLLRVPHHRSSGNTDLQLQSGPW